MRQKKIGLFLIISLLALSLGSLNAASAGTKFASKTTSSPGASKTSACYKARLASTALASLQRDADNANSIISSLANLVPSIKASYSGNTSLSQLYSSLNASTAIYAKATTYSNALNVQAKVLSDDSGKAFLNVTPIKISSIKTLDMQASYNAFKSIFSTTFPLDQAGITITTRNISGNTTTLIQSTNSAYSSSYPIFAVNKFSQATNILAASLAQFDFADFTTKLVNNINPQTYSFSVSYDSPSALDQYFFNSTYTPFESLMAEPDYYLSELNAIGSLIQQMKALASVATMKLPKC